MPKLPAREGSNLVVNLIVILIGIGNYQEEGTMQFNVKVPGTVCDLGMFHE